MSETKSQNDAKVPLWIKVFWWMSDHILFTIGTYTLLLVCFYEFLLRDYILRIL